MSHQLPPAMFLADALGLDFLNSIATPVDTPVDWLPDGDGLLSWLAQAGMVPETVLAEMRERAMPGELDSVAAQARGLRDWFRGFVQSRKGRPLTADALQDLQPLNRLLERDEGYSQIVVGGGGLALGPFRRWRSPDSLLLPIAEAMARLVCEEDFTHVKACEGPVCTLMFVDHTRGHARRWCSMALCGNRAKQAAHRHRLKEKRGEG
ncbi:CGNR zinc finger domain-containing protein [Inquilinus sp. CA228]|uniref:CGNR zinc finger domain-containing protein n=1 Tax=Inquilinus sp. CA228 TaxID=3455609 RepID=UPI003F8D5E56